MFKGFTVLLAATQPIINKGSLTLDTCTGNINTRLIDNVHRNMYPVFVNDDHACHY